jgi:hypothetical protein
MKEIKAIYFVTMILALISGDPVHSLVVYNASKKERQIEVIGILRGSIAVLQLQPDIKFGKVKMTSIKSTGTIGGISTLCYPEKSRFCKYPKRREAGLLLS